MTRKDFWRKSKVAVIGGGSWGTVLAHLASANVDEVRIWVRDEDSAREINSSRINKTYVPELSLAPKVRAYSSRERVMEGGVELILWALPSDVARAQARAWAPMLQGHELLIHATKGIEQGTLKRISQVLGEELPCPRIGVISGPNLALEIARGEPAAAEVASEFCEVIEAGHDVLTGDRFRVVGARDVVGLEWAGTLKNILAIAAGAIDAQKFGWNARALLLTQGLAEMVRFGKVLGAQPSTFLGLAGMGDLLATCSSPLSRNFRVGARLAQGEPLPKILEELGSTAEGVRTTRFVWEFSIRKQIAMPITGAVFRMLDGGASSAEIFKEILKEEFDIMH